jgi:RNA polymerase primary sigma factor
MANSASGQEDLTAWMNTAGRYKLLSEEEILGISRKIKASNPGSAQYAKYVNKLTIHNLRLVTKFVNSFMNGKTRKNFGCPETVDYLQVGSLGLRRAAECFDPTAGYKFSTYAYPWIRSFVSRYNMKISSIFHVPENALRDSWHYEKHGVLFTKDKKIKRDEQYCLDLITRVKAAQAFVSLDMPISSDNDNLMTLGTLIESHYGTSVNDGEFSAEIEDMIRNAGLTKIQVEIIKSYYLDGITMEQISCLHDLTREKIKSLKDSAIKSLRAINGLV